MHAVKNSLLLFIFLSLFFSGPRQTAAQNDAPHVLLLHSYHAGWDWSDDVTRGIQESLAGVAVELHIEYLDTKRDDSAANRANFRTFLQNRYRTVPLDLVIVVDNNALTFWVENQAQLFPDLPVVFTGINNFSPDLLGEQSAQFTGVVEQTEIAATLEIITENHPDAPEIWVIGDQTSTGQAAIRSFLQAVEEKPYPWQWRVFDDLTAADLENLGAGSSAEIPVLFLLFNRDSNGAVYRYVPGFKLFADNAAAPIYSVWDFYLGEGIVGGRLTNGEAQGEAAGELAREILAGTAVADLPIITASPNQYMFDAAQLARFNISAGDLPANSILINTTPSFYQQYKWWIWGSLTVSTLLLIIFISLNLQLRLREKMNQALQTKEKKYRQLFEEMPIGLFSTSADGYIQKVNKSFANLLGYDSPDALKNKRTIELYGNPDDREKIVELLKEENVLTRFETQFNCNDGRLIDINLTARRITNDQGELIGYDGSLEDISDKKMAERALQAHRENLEQAIEERTAALKSANEKLQQQNESRKRMAEALLESETKYRLLADVSPVGMGQMDPDFNLIYVNDRWLRMTGWSFEVMEGDQWLRIIHPEDRKELLRSWYSTLAVEDSFSAEFRLVTPDKQDVWVLGQTNKLYGAHGRAITGYLCTMTNITHQKRIERNLAKARNEAEAATRAKSEFLANMSHEIRTPMNAVIGMTRLLLNSPLDEEQKDFVDTIRTSGDLLLSIINNILDFSKIEANKLELEAQPFNLHECVTGVTDLLSEQAEEKGLSLYHRFGADVPAWVRGDVTRLRQILVNLAANGLKFTKAGGVTITVSCADCETEGMALKFAVTDTGIGIPEEKLSRLFKSFSQVDASTTRKFGGTGLGLTISKRLCELMGGRMWVESEVGRGSTFFFTIRTTAVAPIVAPQPTPAAKKQPLFDQSLAEHHPLRILLAEDNLINQKVALKLLGRFGYLADVAANGVEAVTAVRKTQYDLILMDIQMPEMDGVAATKEIHALFPGTNRPRIVAMTADALSGAKEAYIAVGMDDYISKPIRVPELKAVLETCKPALETA